MLPIRERDAVDYLVLSAVTLLVYYHLPWRSQFHDALRDGAVVTGSYAASAGIEAFLVGVVVLAGVFLVYLAEVLPRRE